jgi:hypothetical protein
MYSGGTVTIFYFSPSAQAGNCIYNLKERRVMTKNGLIIIALLASLTIFASIPAQALEPIPRESGFNGFIQPGVGYYRFKSNMVARLWTFEFSDDKADSLNDNPDGKSGAIYLLTYSLGYTFAGTRTQVFVGSDLTDMIRLDYGQQVGVKQEIGSLGLLQGGILFNTIATEVWEDPYTINENRDETDRDTMGLRLTWDRIMGSQLQLQYSYRDIDIQNEKSGEFLGLSPGDRKLLERDGDRHVVEALYRFNFAQKHWLAPALIYSNDDRDGDAMSSDTLDLQLTYAYRGDPFTFIANGFIGWADYDKRNPIFDKTQEDDRYGFGTSLYYKNPWGWNLFGSFPMNFFINAVVADVDSNIDFYEQQVFFSTAGVFFKW